MTCKQLGGPCEFAHHGGDANDVIKAQDAHLKERLGAGDAPHQSAADEMSGRWKHPIAAMGWYRSAQRDFVALPDD